MDGPPAWGWPQPVRYTTYTWVYQWDEPKEQE